MPVAEAPGEAVVEGVGELLGVMEGVSVGVPVGVVEPLGEPMGVREGVDVAEGEAVARGSPCPPPRQSPRRWRRGFFFRAQGGDREPEAEGEPEAEPEGAGVGLARAEAEGEGVSPTASHRPRGCGRAPRWGERVMEGVALAEGVMEPLGDTNTAEQVTTRTRVASTAYSAAIMLNCIDIRAAALIALCPKPKNAHVP